MHKHIVTAALVVLLGGFGLVGCSSKSAKTESAPTAGTAAEPSTGTSSSTNVAKTSPAKKANLGATSSGNAR